MNQTQTKENDSWITDGGKKMQQQKQVRGLTYGIWGKKKIFGFYFLNNVNTNLVQNTADLRQR